MTTIYDIAKRAEVSPMTVSRVINKSEQISDLTRKKVEAVIKELGYIPNSAARSLISKKTKILSLLITDITNPFFTKVARGAEDKARQLGFQILLSNSDEDFKKEEEYIETLLSTNVDGVLLAPTGDQSKNNIRKLIKRDIPFVLIDRELEGVKSDRVLGDNYEGTRKLIEHLVQQGHQDIALINGPLSISTARERQRAYIETLKLSNLMVNPDLMSEVGFKKDDADAVINKLISLPESERPTAIFAANNFIAVNAIQALRKFGLEVPQDMSVVCFENFEPVSGINSFLTSAVQPAYSFGYTGIQFLSERIEGTAPKEYRKIVLSPEIVIRNSSRPIKN